MSRIISSGSKVAANIKAGASKITAKVQRGINKSIKTVKNLANPKTMRQKTRAAVSGVKATMSSIKKAVSGKISKAEKFAGTQKLALLSAAKTAKGAVVKYTILKAATIPTTKTVFNNQGKNNKGQVLGIFDSKQKNTIIKGAKEFGQGIKAGFNKTINIIAAPGNALRNASYDINTGNYSSMGRDFVKGLKGEKQTSVMDLLLTKQSQQKFKTSNPNLYQFTNLTLSNADLAILIGGSGGQASSALLKLKAGSSVSLTKLPGLTKRLVVEETGSFDPFFGLGRKGTSNAAARPLYRYMNEGELKAVQETGLLRGGRPGKTYWTDSRFRSAERAAERLSLEELPQYRVEFNIKNSPLIEGGSRVEPFFGRSGSGREYWSTDPVEAEIINAQPIGRRY